MIWLLALLLLTLLWLRQPVLVLLGAAAIFVYTLFDSGHPEYVVYDLWEAFNKEVLLAIPLFMFAGAVMSRGSIARRLIDFAVAVTRGMPGVLPSPRLSPRPGLRRFRGRRR